MMRGWVLTKRVCGVSPDIVIGEVCIYVFVKNNTEHVITKLFVRGKGCFGPKEARAVRISMLWPQVYSCGMTLVWV
jgi:hypothetical protein